MTEFENLKSAFDSATPRPDPEKRAANLALAQKNFETLQGSGALTRPTSVTGLRANWTGVISMLNTFTSKGAIGATTALVAVGMLFISPVGQNWMQPPAPLQSVDDLIAAAPENFTTAEIAPTEVQDMDDSSDLIAPKAVGRVITPSMAPTSQEFGLAFSAADARGPATEIQSFAADSDSMHLTSPADTEAFANADSASLKITAEEPVSTFSIDVDTASYSIVRSSLMQGQLPQAAAVRVEEMINYFPYAYPSPAETDGPFKPSVGVMTTPWNPDTQLVHIAIQGKMPEREARQPLNLVFLIDTSGSMDQPNKLPLLKQSFRLMLSQLGPDDQIAIVEYAGSAGQVLEPTPASERSQILHAINSLGAGGATNGQGGLEQAYATAATMNNGNGIGRVILATDGDFNVGMNSPEKLEGFIAEKRDSGIFLSVLGFGRGNLDDATMQTLAQNGNGQAAYIDTLAEAQKVLVDQLSGALFPIANDVKVQVEFNPAQIAEYRLIGYETRTLRREDFNNDSVDAGELGAGHSVTALYEVTPVGSPAQMSDPLRYQASVTATKPDELGFLKLRYKSVGEPQSQLIEYPITSDLLASSDAQFATAIAGFGQLLRGSTYVGDWGYDEAIALAKANRGDDTFGYRNEALQLMRLAQSLSN